MSLYMSMWEGVSKYNTLHYSYVTIELKFLHAQMSGNYLPLSAINLKILSY